MKLSEYLEATGLRVKQLAETASLIPAQVSVIARGKRTPSAN